MFIEKLNLTADIGLVKKDLENVLTMSSWGVENQIGLTHRINPKTDPWKDCVGSLYDRETGTDLANESEFTEYNKDAPVYTRQKLEELASLENIKIGRVRFMKLMPKTGLTVHADTSHRYHLVLETNIHSYIAHTLGKTNAMCFHLPSDNYFYKVDTTKHHFVYNGGYTPRIHLVICPI